MPVWDTADEAVRLLTQAHEQLSEHLHIVELMQDHWRVLFNDGEGGYRIDWSPTWGRLVLTANLGRPLPGDELAALNLALSYNALWREMGNLRMARDGGDGELMLIGEWGPDDGNASAFNTTVLHFECLRRWWTGALKQAAAECSRSPPALSDLTDRVR